MAGDVRGAEFAIGQPVLVSPHNEDARRELVRDVLSACHQPPYGVFEVETLGENPRDVFLGRLPPDVVQEVVTVPGGRSKSIEDVP